MIDGDQPDPVDKTRSVCIGEAIKGKVRQKYSVSGSFKAQIFKWEAAFG
jgi:hypothetical protein